MLAALKMLELLPCFKQGETKSKKGDLTQIIKMYRKMKAIHREVKTLNCAPGSHT
jgi:hypothetical protein